MSKWRPSVRPDPIGRSSVGTETGVPPYWTLRLTARTFEVIGYASACLCVLATWVIIIVAIIGSLKPAPDPLFNPVPPSAGEKILAFVGSLWTIVVWGICSLIVAAVGQLLHVVRDMAITYFASGEGLLRQRPLTDDEAFKKFRRGK